MLDCSAVRLHSLLTMDHSTLGSAELIRVCARTSDEAAWEEFSHRFGLLIFTVATRALRKSPYYCQDTLNDLIQTIYVKLLQKKALRHYEERENIPPEAFLNTVVGHAAIDFIRSRATSKHGGGAVELDDASEDVSLEPGKPGTVQAMERDLRLEEAKRHMTEVLAQPGRERDRIICDLYYGQGFTAAEIAALPSIGLTVKGVESRLARIVDLVRQRMSQDE